MAEEKLDATFFAFRKRDQRFVLTRAAGAYLGFYLLICALYAAAAWSTLAPAYGWYMNAVVTTIEGGEPPAPPPELMTLIPIGLGVALVFWILFAVFEAACLRWLVRGESGGGLLGLRLGADTWRVFAVYLMWLLVSLAMCVIIVALYLALQAVGSIGGPMQLAAMILGGIAPLGLLALWLFVGVRLAPAAAASIAEQRFVFFGAWRVTRGHFWPLLGSFLIVIVGYVVIAMIVGQIIQIPIDQTMAPVLHDMISDGATEANVRRMSEAMQTPTFLIFGSIYIIATGIMASVYYIAMFGVNARVVLASREAPSP